MYVSNTALDQSEYVRSMSKVRRQLQAEVLDAGVYHPKTVRHNKTRALAEANLSCETHHKLDFQQVSPNYATCWRIDRLSIP